MGNTNNLKMETERKIILSILESITDLSKYKCIDKYITAITTTGYKGYLSAGTYARYNKIFIPNKTKNMQPLNHLLLQSGLLKCSKCKNIQDTDIFSKSSYKSTGFNSWCKKCFSEYQKDEPERWREYRANRKSILLCATPTWSNRDKIKEIYASCPTGYQVDHIVPLQGKNVCGLHIDSNLQYLTENDNLIKSNKF